jgi:hypothetical protein
LPAQGKPSPRPISAVIDRCPSIFTARDQYPSIPQHYSLLSAYPSTRRSISEWLCDHIVLATRLTILGVIAIETVNCSPRSMDMGEIKCELRGNKRPQPEIPLPESSGLDIHDLTDSAETTQIAISDQRKASPRDVVAPRWAIRSSSWEPEYSIVHDHADLSLRSQVTIAQLSNVMNHPQSSAPEPVQTVWFRRDWVLNPQYTLIQLIPLSISSSVCAFNE